MENIAHSPQRVESYFKLQNKKENEMSQSANPQTNQPPRKDAPPSEEKNKPQEGKGESQEERGKFGDRSNPENPKV